MRGRRWMALCFALGSEHLLPGRPVPRGSATGRRLGRRCHVLRRLDPLHGGWGAADVFLSWAGWPLGEVGGRPGSRRTSSFPRGPCSSTSPVTPGDACRPDERRLRPTRRRLDWRRLRSTSSSQARSGTAPLPHSDGTAGCPRGRLQDGVSRPSTCSATYLFGISAVAGFVVPCGGLDSSTSPLPTRTYRRARPATTPALSTHSTPVAPRRCRCAVELLELEPGLERDVRRLA